MYIKTSGIYKIENINNGKIYIGASNNIEKRWKEHVLALNNESHHNIELQKDWNEYKKESFLFTILEECQREHLEDKECQWIKQTSCTYNKYKNKSYGNKYSNEELYCEICGCHSNETSMIYSKKNKYGIMLCSRHYEQMQRSGKITDASKSMRSKKIKNEFILYDDYAEVCLYNVNGIEVARSKIDLEDVDKCKPYKWLFNDAGYVVGTYNKSTIRLHRFIMNATNDKEVDHIYHDTLDNRKCNLRIVTKIQNSQNKRIRTNNTSGVTGVSFIISTSKWYSHICVNTKKLYLGCYDDFDEAVKVRKEAEIKYFGDYACKELVTECIDKE